jgi:hypothetical protein
MPYGIGTRGDHEQQSDHLLRGGRKIGWRSSSDWQRRSMTSSASASDMAVEVASTARGGHDLGCAIAAGAATAAVSPDLKCRSGIGRLIVGNACWRASSAESLADRRALRRSARSHGRSSVPSGSAKMGGVLCHTVPFLTS